MFLRLQLLTLNITTATLLIFFLCLGSQNLDKKYSLDFLINKTVSLPIGFLLGTSFTVSQMPVWCTQILQGDRFRNSNSTGTATAAPDSDSLVYGIGTDSSGTNAVTSQYHTSGEGWVGVTTYNDTNGNLSAIYSIILFIVETLFK